MSAPAVAPTAQRLSLWLASLLAAGCVSVGPDYTPPDPQAPAQWISPYEADPAQAEDLARWWRRFDDPTLDALVAAALDANLDLATAKARLQESRARRKLAGAQRGPRVNASGSLARSGTASSGSGVGASVGSTPVVGGGTRTLYNAGLDASWELDIFGANRRGAEAAQADLEASAASLQDVQISLISEVALAYVDLRAAARRLEIAEASLKARAESLELAKWRAMAGQVSELDVIQAETDLHSAEANLPSLRTTAAQARHQLAALLGQPPQGLPVALDASAQIPTAGAGAPLAVPAEIIRRRPDIRAAERQLAAQTARVGQAEAARYPSFTLSGSVTLQGVTGNPSNTLWSILGGVTAPIFDSGRIEANVEIQDALLTQARLTYRGAVITALREVEDALVDLANTAERLQRLETAVASARQTQIFAQQQYEGGLTDVLTVLDSQRSLLSLEDQLASGGADLARARIRLYKALGGGYDQPAPSDRSEST